MPLLISHKTTVPSIGQRQNCCKHSRRQSRNQASRKTTSVLHNSGGSWTFHKISRIIARLAPSDASEEKISRNSSKHEIFWLTQWRGTRGGMDAPWIKRLEHSTATNISGHTAAGQIFLSSGEVKLILSNKVRTHAHAKEPYRKTQWCKKRTIRTSTPVMEI